MRRNNMRLLLALLAGAVLLTGIPGWSQQAKSKKPPAQPVQEEQEYTEEEFDAYEKATKEKEPDPDKRLAAINAFMEKFPKSKLLPHIQRETQVLMFDYNTSKNWTRLLEMAEKQLKANPSDAQSLDYVAAAAQQLGDHKKFIEYGEKVYAMKPTPEYAYFIAQSYKKIDNKAKYLEWAEKALPFPPEDFGVRMEFVDKYSKEKNLDKASEYAKLALKSMEIAKKPDSVSDAEWQKATTGTKKSCYYLIALNAYEKKKWQETINELNIVLKIDKKYEPAYYYIGHSLWKLEKVEEAIESFAKAVVLKGEFASQSKEYLESLYKAIHNNTIIGIDKVYNRNKEELGIKP
jgi:tetratricopeptide (TPR) repeat protein